MTLVWLYAVRALFCPYGAETSGQHGPNFIPDVAPRRPIQIYQKNLNKSLVYKGALIHRCRCCAPCRGRCVLRPRWEATLPKPLVRSAQPNTRFAFVRLHRVCYLPH